MINWDNIKEGYDWFAVDHSGDGYIYSSIPIIKKEGYWVDTESQFLSVGRFTCPDWKKSLIQRPVAVAESKGSNGFSVDQIKGFFETLTAQGAVGYNLDADDLMDMLNEHVAQEYNKQQDAITLLRKSGYIVTKETE